MMLPIRIGKEVCIGYLENLMLQDPDPLVGVVSSTLGNL
jgi:hypothetical protein